MILLICFVVACAAGDGDDSGDVELDGNAACRTVLEIYTLNGEFCSQTLDCCPEGFTLAGVNAESEVVCVEG